VDLIEVEAGGYRAVPGVFQYSAGVAARPGYAIRRVRFRRPVPLAEGFDRVERILAEAARPSTAFCACELRSPAPFTDETFRAFNETYVERLARWGLFDGRTNPVARSNVCPELDPPAEPGFHAFSFTVEDPDAAPTFVIAGSGEAREGFARYEEATVRFGETTPDAIAEKARYVLDEMERRMAALGFRWTEASAVQVYTVHDLHPFLGSEIVRRGAATGGLTWHYCRPPVHGLEYEMDCRHVAREDVL
jgi:hypothetical protein